MKCTVQTPPVHCGHALSHSKPLDLLRPRPICTPEPAWRALGSENKRQLARALTKLIRSKSCPHRFLLVGRATKLWGFPSEVSFIFTQSLQQTEWRLSSKWCISCFCWQQISKGKNTNKAAAGFSQAGRLLGIFQTHPTEEQYLLDCSADRARNNFMHQKACRRTFS